MSEIDQHASLSTTPVSLRQLYEFARAADEKVYVQAAKFLHHEMPIRLAKKVKELESMPGGLTSTTSIQIVRDWYIQSFIEITEMPVPANISDEQRFCDMITRMKDRHRNQVQVMARGIHEYMRRSGCRDLSPEVQHFLDGFFLSRIGIRFLLGQHIATHQNREGWVGIICAQTSPLEVAEEAAANAANICRRTYGDPPEVRFLGRTNLRFKYIPSHLHHMFFELFKNSFRATVETNRGKKLPPVQVVIAGGQEDISVRISDQGGGIPRSGIDRIWSYTYTTAQPLHDLIADEDIMAGFGFGLPLTRLYAKYFGGNLQILSLEGYGTDAYLHLNRLGTSMEAVL